MNIAIVGATGNVGRKILEVLEKKELAVDNYIYWHHLEALDLKLILMEMNMR